jgi:DNA-binding response OmpR family regulator
MSAGKIGILVLDDEASGHGVLRQMLDSEGWRVRVVPDSGLLLTELRSAEWSLVIANVAMTGPDTAAFHVLRELALVPANEGARVRVLFLVPEFDRERQTILENARLPYVLRPFNLQDFLEKVSDLLLEIHAIENPIRQVRYDFKGRDRKRKQAKSSRETSMFAARGDYTMTEEELAEYEKQEQEDIKKRPLKKKFDLGQP